MRSTRWCWLLLLAFTAACNSGGYVKIRTEIPAPQTIDLSSYSSLVMTHFILENDIDDFDPNQEILDFLSVELAQSLDKDVSIQDITPGGEQAFEDRDFWKNLIPEAAETLIMTGSLEYTRETRKALIGKERKQFEDPFPDKSRLATRKFFTLNIAVFLIDAETGETVYKREFKETQGSDNPNQTAPFAFSDLLHNVKEKLIREVAGGDRVQERYLIYR